MLINLVERYIKHYSKAVPLNEKWAEPTLGRTIAAELEHILRKKREKAIIKRNPEGLQGISWCAVCLSASPIIGNRKTCKCGSWSVIFGPRILHPGETWEVK